MNAGQKLIQKINPRARAIFFGLCALACALTVLRGTATPLAQYYSSSRIVYDRNGEILRLTLSSDDRFRLWVPLREVSPLVVEAALLKEDQHFYQHFGVNPVSLLKAVVSTYLRHARKMGGSTITMQVAKMMGGIQSNTILGKTQQIAQALKLELFHSKSEILEAYLNLIPLGANIEGVGAASLIYFHRPTSRMTLPEALAIMEFPQNPNERSFSHSPEFKLSQRVKNRWLHKHPESKSLAREAELPVQGHSLEDLPFRAPHFVEKVLRLKPSLTTLQTTLDLRLQKLLERQLTSYIEGAREKGIQNGAALLIDSRTLQVRAAVGSVDYFNDAIKGQVNGTEAKRSPGSALKPFVYGLAIDQGLIHPQTMLKDAPTSFGAFDPENFDRDYVGPISAKDALIRSRNIPAVQLFSQLKGYSLYQLLTDAGVTRMRGEKFYGYALPLGGSEITMEEIASLYAVFANEGEYQPLSYFQNEKLPKAKILLSRESAYLVHQMLSENLRPDQTYKSAWLKSQIPVAWKTGTSHGFRDAWSVGVVGPYVLAVWLGNFNGEGNQNLIGRDAAAPLFFRVVDALGSSDPSLKDFPALEKPRKVVSVKVCAISGQLPGKHCHSLIETEYIAGTSPIKACDIHRVFRVNPKTGYRLCDQSSGKEEVFEVWPSDLLRLYKKAGLPRREPPPFEAACALAARETATHLKAPIITSPKGEMTYLYRFGERAPSSQPDALPLSANVEGDVNVVHWFMNEVYLGKSEKDKPLLWKMHPGTYTARAVDDQGRSDSRRFKVEVSE